MCAGVQLLQFFVGRSLKLQRQQFFFFFVGPSTIMSSFLLFINASRLARDTLFVFRFIWIYKPWMTHLIAFHSVSHLAISLPLTTKVNSYLKDSSWYFLFLASCSPPATMPTNTHNANSTALFMNDCAVKQTVWYWTRLLGQNEKVIINGHSAFGCWYAANIGINSESLWGIKISCRKDQAHFLESEFRSVLKEMGWIVIEPRTYKNVQAIHCRYIMCILQCQCKESEVSIETALTHAVFLRSSPSFAT